MYYFFLYFFQLLSTISTSELRQFLSQPNVIGNSSDICLIFNKYNNTPAFLETVCPSSEGCPITYIIFSLKSHISASLTLNVCLSIGGCPRWCEDGDPPLCLAFGADKRQQIWGWFLVRPTVEELSQIPQQEPHQLHRSAECFMCCLPETVSLYFAMSESSLTTRLLLVDYMIHNYVLFSSQ